MLITQESTGEMTATIQVKVTEEDYLENVNKQLKDRQRKAVIPGFRPGKVPLGHIKKMYGVALILEEVNKLVSEKLMAYIQDNNIPVLGYPIPDEKSASQIDWHTQTEFDLNYNIGLVPEFELKFSDEVKVDYYRITADEVQINEQIVQLTKRFGSETNVEVSDAEDLLKGKIVKLNDDNSVPEGVEPTESVIYPKQFESSEKQALFVGLKNGDSLDFDLREYFPNTKDVVKVLKIYEKEAKEAKGNYRFTVDEISRLIPAEINDDFYKSVYPHIEDIDESKFRAVVKSEIEMQYVQETDKKFLQEAVQKLMEVNNFDLPVGFIRAWMLDRQNGKISQEDIEKELPGIIENLRWDIIRNKIFDTYELHVTEKDIRDYVRNYFVQRFGPAVNEDPERLEKFIDETLKKQKDAEKIEEELLTRRLLTVMQGVLKPQIREVSLAEFIELNFPQHSHGHVHDEHCNHDHDHDHDHEHEHDHSDSQQ